MDHYSFPTACNILCLEKTMEEDGGGDEEIDYTKCFDINNVKKRFIKILNFRKMLRGTLEDVNFDSICDEVFTYFINHDYNLYNPLIVSENMI